MIFVAAAKHKIPNTYAVTHLTCTLDNMFCKGEAFYAILGFINYSDEEEAQTIIVIKLRMHSRKQCKRQLEIDFYETN